MILSVFFILLALLAYIGESSLKFDAEGMMPVNPIYTSNKTDNFLNFPNTILRYTT